MNMDRLIRTQRFLRHGIAGHGVGAGPAAAAESVVFAGAAFALVRILIAEILEHTTPAASL